MEAYNCPVVDGENVMFDPRQNSNSGRPDSGEIGEDDRYFWDYCTPAPVENIGEEDGQGIVEAETLPERVDGGKLKLKSTYLSRCLQSILRSRQCSPSQHFCELRKFLSLCLVHKTLLREKHQLVSILFY